MGKTRAGEYGRALASLINYVIDASNSQKIARDNYRGNFMKELKNYSFEPRKKGEPTNAGCNNELSGLTSISIKNPQHLARVIKEGIHLMYQKQTARKVMQGLLDNL